MDRLHPGPSSRPNRATREEWENLALSNCFFSGKVPFNDFLHAFKDIHYHRMSHVKEQRGTVPAMLKMNAVIRVAQRRGRARTAMEYVASVRFAARVSNR